MLCTLSIAVALAVPDGVIPHSAPLPHHPHDVIAAVALAPAFDAVPVAATTHAEALARARAATAALVTGLGYTSPLGGGA